MHMQKMYTRTPSNSLAVGVVDHAVDADLLAHVHG